MDKDFQIDFVTIFGFNWAKASSYYGVCERTVKRWYQEAPPIVVKRLTRIVARGYLPEHSPFCDWRIEGQTIHTPQGPIDSGEIEFLSAYKWKARQLERRFKNRSKDQRELLNLVDQILNISDSLKNEVKRAL